MNFLIVTPYYMQSSSGGIESEVEIVSELLSKKKQKCIIIAPQYQSVDMQTHDNQIKVYFTELLKLPASSQVSEKESTIFFQNILKSENIDIIIAHNLHAWIHPIVTQALISLAHNYGVPIYLRIHNFCYPKEKAGLLEYNWSGYLCVSQALTNQIRHIGVKPEKIRILYPPIDTEAFVPSPHNQLRSRLGIDQDSKIILHASRLIGGPSVFKDKGILSIIEQLARSPQTDHLILCFAPPPINFTEEYDKHRQFIFDFAKFLNISGRLHVVSESYDRMADVYNGADIFVLLSKIETFGRVYAEASACERPVIGTKVGGVPEVILHNKNGFLVENLDEVPKILSKLDDKERCKQLGEVGRKHVKNKAQ